MTLSLLGWEPTAVFSPCQPGQEPAYRYTLTRRWEDGPAMLVIGLNPSTATAEKDDQTIRRCTHFARREGFAALTVGNLFAYRATDPRDMKAAADPVGPDNDAWLIRLALEHPLRVAAWGVHGNHLGRAHSVLDRGMLGDVRCFGTTKGGHPRHPCYLANNVPLVSYIW